MLLKKEHLAGPKILEHMVDTVLYFEGDDTSPISVWCAPFKNRFGGVNEVGIFAMTEQRSARSYLIPPRYSCPAASEISLEVLCLLPKKELAHYWSKCRP